MDSKRKKEKKYLKKSNKCNHSSYQIQWRRYSFSKTELKPQAAKNRMKCGKVNTKRKKKQKMGNWEEGRGKRSSLVSDTYV